MAAPSTPLPSIYSRQIYSGICVCTHPATRHHGHVVGSPEYIKQTRESRIAGECLHYGFNEFTDSHCPEYWDVANPNPDPSADLRPTPPSLEVRHFLRAFRLAHLDPTASALKTEDQWLAAVSALHADTNTAQIDKDHILRLSLGISDHNDDAIDAPWFHRVALHVDRCFPAQDPDSAYDTWWLVLQAVNDLSPLRSEGLTDLPLAPETLASILPSLASQLFAAFPHPGLEAEPLAC